VPPPGHVDGEVPRDYSQAMRGTSREKLRKRSGVIDRRAVAIVIGAIVLSVVIFVIIPDSGGRLIAVLTVLGLVLAAMAVPRSVPSPNLKVEFCRKNPTEVTVVLHNKGKGQAENVEVDFDPGPAEIYDESGRPPAPLSGLTRNPPRYSGGDRVLGPGDDWTIAKLVYYAGKKPPLSYEGEVRAKGMESKKYHSSLSEPTVDSAAT
jgi:hypothetical protein